MITDFSSYVMYWYVLALGHFLFILFDVLVCIGCLALPLQLMLCIGMYWFLITDFSSYVMYWYVLVLDHLLFILCDVVLSIGS